MRLASIMQMIKARHKNQYVTPLMHKIQGKMCRDIKRILLRFIRRKKSKNDGIIS